MKKLLLITFLFLITPYAKADMDYVCEVPWLFYNLEDGTGANALIKENCERDNIVYFTGVPRMAIPIVISMWCRHDREINFIEVTEAQYQSRISCVLYDNKPRKDIVMKGVN